MNGSQARARAPRTAPQLAQAALQRARLTVVPRTRRRNRAPRVPFVTLISAIMLGGVVGLLLFNTSMQQASFRETALERQASDLSARKEALELQLQSLRDPQRVAERAQQMGLVIPSTPAGVLHLGSGRVDGDPSPAAPTGKVPSFPPPETRPAVLDPPPVTVRDTSHRDDRGARRGRDDRTGAPERDRRPDRLRLGDGRRSR